jgi:ubiquinone/menaquinone biosynthesis C-methylase UbiE
MTAENKDNKESGVKGKAQENAQQKNLIREQFTRTAEVFGDYAVSSRVHEAELLARMVHAGATDRVVDLACGPGTLALRFARHVKWAYGVDLTPAILERARNSAAAESLDNLFFSIGDAQALPFADGALDIAVTSYSLHHMSDPARVIAEMARVVKPGGRVGVIDIRMPEDSQIADLNNRIERSRDASHTRSLKRSEFDAMFAASGLRVFDSCIEEHPRAFDHWMLVAGSKPGDRLYDETRAMMESTMADDSANFHPRYVDKNGHRTVPGASGELYLTNTVQFLAAEKT